MENELDYTIVELQPCPNECDRLARHIRASNEGGIVTIQCFECGRTRTGSCRDIPSIVTAWNGEDPQ